MNNERRNESEDTNQDEHFMKLFGKKNEDPKGSCIWKYIKVTLIMIIIFIGINKYVLPRISSESVFFSNTSTQIALNYYLDKYGYEGDPKDVQSMFRRFGCHDEIHISINGKLVKKLSYNNGRVYEIE